MTSADAVFAGSIPALYDRHLGPLLFEPYADDMAARVAALGPADILETAAGSGIVTAALAAALPAAKIVATDLNQAMLDIAAGKPELAKVRFQAADAQNLPFPDATFDALVCQFGVMFFPDKAAGYAEARRVLRPGSRFVLNVWDRLELNEISQVVHAATAALFPEDPPSFLARVPFGWHDESRLRDGLAAAGFGRVEVERVTLQTPAASAAEAASGLCLGTPLRAELEARGAGAADRAVAAVTQALIDRFGGGAISGAGQALVVTANV